MAENGNPTQWGSTSPREEVLRNDIRQQQLYVIENDAKDKILGVFALIIGKTLLISGLNREAGKMRVSMVHFIG